MRRLKPLVLVAALGLLGGAVLDAQTGLVRQVLLAGPDAGVPSSVPPAPRFMPATKSAPLFEPRSRNDEKAPPQAQPQRAPVNAPAAAGASSADAGK